jgi:hypothetical protein
LTGTASSLAGSLLGGLLNSYAGDYVRSLELRQVGGYTKFNLSGKVNNFRYTIGGTTDVFSDFSRANVKIEYPFFQRLFLRLERKEALTETNNTSEMINELGLKEIRAASLRAKKLPEDLISSLNTNIVL